MIWSRFIFHNLTVDHFSTGNAGGCAGDQLQHSGRQFNVSLDGGTLRPVGCEPKVPPREAGNGVWRWNLVRGEARKIRKSCTP